MSSALDDVRELLRSTDEVKAILEVTSIPSSSDSEPTGEEIANRRILAVVSHKDDWDLIEEGCVFVCKPRSTSNVKEVEIQRVLPIYGNFAIVMSQMRRNTLELGKGSVKAPSESSRSGFSISITPAEGLQSNLQPAVFFTRNVQSLREFVAECKRMREISDVESNVYINLAQSTTHFSWLRPYILKQISPALLAIIPPDLRQVNKPTMERLSTSSAGQPGDDHADIRTVRDEWVRAQARRTSTTGKRSIKLRLGTFNVNGKLPSQDLASWVQGTQAESQAAAAVPVLPPVKNMSPLSLGEIVRNPFDLLKRGQSSSHPQPQTIDPVDPEDADPDVIVLGFQELDLSTEALIYSLGTAREDAWCRAVFASLGEKAEKYEKLVSRQLVGMLIVVIVKKSLKGCFTDIKATSAGAGILGVMGNKGATAVRVTFTPPGASGSTVLTFVNAHLAAFDEMVDKRNQDFHDLSKRLTFEVTWPSEEDQELDYSLPTLSAYESDALFWMVYLNYRVDIPDLDMRRILREEGWDASDKFESFLRYDQLVKAQKHEKAFVGFRESAISHFPTYRFSSGLGMDVLGYDLKRKPAWTDRILYIPSPTCRVEPLAYVAYPQITMSDHRPVAADFRVDVDFLNREEYVSSLKLRYREVDHLEGTQERRGLQIDNAYLDFGTLQYQVPQVRTVKVTNASKGPCAFRFIPVQNDSPIHPEWLSIEPLTGVLLPEDSIELTLTAYVSNSIATTLNRQPNDLSGTLILHTLLGKDHFISVSAEYERTCFGNSLAYLTKLPGPIRSFKASTDLLDEKHRKNAPTEIHRLVNWLMTNTASTERVFLEPGDEATIGKIRGCLDTGDDFPWNPEENKDAQIAFSFGSTLLLLLDSLPDPVIPGILHPKCVEMTNRDEAFELLDAVHPAAVNVWVSVTAFLHFISKSVEDDVEDQPAKLAAVFAPILLRDDPTSLAPPISPAKKEEFLLYFIS
ncbi:DNase I-like protein [Ephemerocybe angulata]|uniref:DNase I-like protein n=1 Tax=Ephemerocybe angulata TaxID=980116 RepID=A0A8H6HR35_9AGAR|nr:DNase I-like protein [Tulosesus angulatus]